MLLTKLFKYVITATAKYSIDESHGLSHSMDILRFSNSIFKEELIINPSIKPAERIVYVSAILHDMCDKKYMNENDGIKEIEYFLEDKLLPQEIDVTKRIISTMSYSTVKKNGFPQLNEFQPAYNIVREADLMASYDFERSMIYHMRTANLGINAAYGNARELFKNRVLKYIDDDLYFTSYAKRESYELHINAMKQMMQWDSIVNNKNLI